MKLSENFDSSEFDYIKGDRTGKKMDREFIMRLQELRKAYGKPIKVSSGIRFEGNHATGKAVDIKCYGSRERFDLVKWALICGFVRIGVYDQHIHLDMVEGKVKGVMWWGKSA